MGKKKKRKYKTQRKQNRKSKTTNDLSPVSYAKHFDNLAEAATTNKKKELCKRNRDKQKECDVKQTVFNGIKELHKTNDSSCTLL